MHLADARWPELGERSDVALVPLGSCEQHGPHLPFVTDAAVAEEVAGRTETSLMAAIAPDTVRLDAAQPGATDPIEVLLPRLLRSGVIAVSPNGVLGDPAGASAAEGEELLAGMVREALDAVLDGSRELDGRLRPAGVPA